MVDETPHPDRPLRAEVKWLRRVVPDDAGVMQMCDDQSNPYALASPLPTARFFDSEKQKTDPPPDFRIFRNRNTHLYRLVRELTPGNGSIERHG